MIQFVVNNQVVLHSLYIENVAQLGRNTSRVIELIKDINDYSTRIYVVENGYHQEVDIKKVFPFFKIAKDRKLTSLIN